jgi:hypothetical protein
MSLINRIKYKFIPRTRLGDRYLAREAFIKAHGRAPSKNGGFNDMIYYIKTGEEIMHPLRHRITDKEFVKEYVKDKVGDQYNVPTIAILRSVEELTRYTFPVDCVIKPTHLSGQVIFRRDGSSVDMARMVDWMRTNYYRWTREVNYRDLAPKIIVEPYIFGRKGVEDYKIHCVQGEARLMWIDIGRQTDHRRNIYTTDWQQIDAAIAHETGEHRDRPANLEEMLDVASALAADLNYIRVDLYSDGKNVLVGELTNCSDDARGIWYRGEKVFTETMFGKRGIREVLDQPSRVEH